MALDCKPGPYRLFSDEEGKQLFGHVVHMTNNIECRYTISYRQLTMPGLLRNMSELKDVLTRSSFMLSGADRISSRFFHHNKVGIAIQKLLLKKQPLSSLVLEENNLQGFQQSIPNPKLCYIIQTYVYVLQ